MTSEGLGEMFVGDSADTCAGNRKSYHSEIHPTRIYSAEANFLKPRIPRSNIVFFAGMGFGPAFPAVVFLAGGPKFGV